MCQRTRRWSACPAIPCAVDGKRVEGPDADWIHLPDPVADAMRALSSRVAELERELPSDRSAGLGGRRVSYRPPAAAGAGPQPGGG